MNNEIQTEEKLLNKNRMKNIVFKSYIFFIIMFLLILILNYSTFRDFSLNSAIDFFINLYLAEENHGNQKQRTTGKTKD